MDLAQVAVQERAMLAQVVLEQEALVLALDQVLEWVIVEYVLELDALVLALMKLVEQVLALAQVLDMVAQVQLVVLQ